MKNDERDELLRRQTDAIEDQAHLLTELLTLIHAQERRATPDPLPRITRWPKPLKRSLWPRLVPETHIFTTRDRHNQEWTVIDCPCGSQTSLRKGWHACYGVLWKDEKLDPAGCGRTFLLENGKVYVHRFAALAAAA